MEKDQKVERRVRRLKEAQKQYGDLYNKLYAYSRNEEFENEYKRAEDVFYIINKEDKRIKFEKFFETYFMQDHITEANKVIAVKFYEDKSVKLTNNERRILQSLGNSYISVYDVLKVEVDRILLKDCFTGKEIYTEDVKLLKGFTEGESMLARIVEVSGVNILIDITVKITDSVKEFVMDDVERLFKQYEKDFPKRYENGKPNMKLFLSFHTYIFYRYIQQLLDEECSDFMRKGLEESQKKAENLSVDTESEEITVKSLIEASVEDEWKEKCVEFWNKYESEHSELKGSEYGWAAATEYFVKKEAGESITQAQISKKYEISPSTLGKRYKELKADMI